MRDTESQRVGKATARSDQACDTQQTFVAEHHPCEPKHKRPNICTHCDQEIAVHLEFVCDFHHHDHGAGCEYIHQVSRGVGYGSGE